MNLLLHLETREHCEKLLLTWLPSYKELMEESSLLLYLYVSVLVMEDAKHRDIYFIQINWAVFQMRYKMAVAYWGLSGY